MKKIYKILIVDDDQNFGKAMLYLLERYNYTVDEACLRLDGFEVICRISEFYS
jgi:DNA-binding response OmpR family regulator